MSVRSDNRDDFCGQRLLSVSMTTSSGSHILCTVASLCPVLKHNLYILETSLFDRLAVEADIVVPKAMQFCPYRMTFDIECMLIKDPLPSSTPRTFYASRHKLVSVSLYSNVPGHTEPERFVVTTMSAKCVERFVHRENAIASRAESILMNEYNVYLK